MNAGNGTTVMETLGALSADAVLSALEARTITTSSKHVIEHLGEPELEALFQALMSRSEGEVRLPAIGDAALRIVPCGPIDVIPFFVAPPGGVRDGSNRGTEGFASSLRDLFTSGAGERPRVLLTLTRAGNETQKSASDPLVDRGLLTLRSLADQLIARHGVSSDDRRCAPIDLVLARTPEERPWQESLERIESFLDATAGIPSGEVGKQLPRLGLFFPDSSPDWDSGPRRFYIESERQPKDSNRLEENATCFEVVERWTANPLEDAELKIRVRFDPRSADVLISSSRGDVDFDGLGTAPTKGRVRNRFNLEGVKVEGALVHHLCREGDVPILVVTREAGRTVRLVLPLMEGKLEVGNYIHLVGWDPNKQKRTINKEAYNWSSEANASVVTLAPLGDLFEINQVVITGGPRTLRNPFDELWVVTYQASAPVIAIETNHRPNLEYQAWVPDVSSGELAYFEWWSLGEEGDRQSIEVGQEKCEPVEDIDEETLAGEEAVTCCQLERDNQQIHTRIFWPSNVVRDPDEEVIAGDFLESIPYLRLSKHARERLVEGMQSKRTHLESITRIGLQGGAWQVRLGETINVRVESHDRHGEEHAVGYLLADPDTLSLKRCSDSDDLVARPLPDVARETLHPFLTARSKLFQALRRSCNALFGTRRFSVLRKPPVPLALLDLTAHEVLIDAYLAAWLELLDIHTANEEPMGPVHTALLDTDTLFELGADDSLQRLTVLPTHPWLLSALLRFQKIMTEEVATFPRDRRPSGSAFLGSDEVEGLAHPVPLDEWSGMAGRDDLRRTDSPPFHWTFVPRSKLGRRGGLEYVRRVVRNRVKRYLQMHQHLADSRRTLRIGFVNPGRGDRLLDGIREWIQLGDEKTTPNVEVLLFHDDTTKEEEVGRAFDELFQRKLRASEDSATDDVLLSKLHYLKRQRPWPEKEDDHVHICFVHDLLREDDYRPLEQKIVDGWDGCFGDGLLATPLRHTWHDRSDERRLVSARGLWMGPGTAPLRRGLEKLLVLVRGRSQGMIQPGTTLYRFVELPTLRKMSAMYDRSDWVVHLDRELSLDLFTVFDESEEDPPTVIEYSDQEDPQTPGYDTITVTRNAAPYVEQLTSVLELTGLSVTSLTPVEKRRQMGLLRDINVLSGSWALDFLLGNIALPSLSNRLKGNVGAALVYRWLERIERPRLAERHGRHVVPIYISLEELIRATPVAGLPIKDGLFQRFSNENEAGSSEEEKLRKICDDLLVLYLTPSVEGQPTRIFGRVIEVKFGESAASNQTISAAIEQVRHTQKILREHMAGSSSARGAPFRYKQLALLLKTQIEQARCLRVVDKPTIDELNIWRLSTDLATGNFRVDYEPGGLKGDAFILSTLPSDRAPGDAEVQFQENVRVVKLTRATLEWLAFQPEDSPTLLATPTDTTPCLEFPTACSPSSQEEVEPVPVLMLGRGHDRPSTPGPATSPGLEPPQAPVSSPSESPVSAPESAFTPTKVPEPVLEDAAPLKKTTAIPVAEAPYPRESLLPVLRRLDKALDGHKIKLDVPLSLEQVDLGPRLVRVYARLQAGTTIKSIRGISEDLAREVGTVSPDVHVCNVPERHSVGIDLPIEGMEYRVAYEQIEDHPSFRSARHELALGFCAGIDVTGHAIWVDLARMPHMLVAGTTGSGKTVFLRSALLTMLQHRSSKELEVRMSSSKPMDFMPFTMVPHGRGQQIADDHQSALHMVSGLVAEMDRRIRLISEAHCDNLVEYNAEHSEPLRYIVAVIDEYAETVISFSDKSDRSEFENGVARLAQKARAAGIHLILCMQRPDSTVLEGRIKSNVLHRFALKLPQSHDSRVILDESGAEALLGKGDMLYKDADGRLFRLQVPFLDKSVLTQRIDRLRGE